MEQVGIGRYGKGKAAIGVGCVGGHGSIVAAQPGDAGRVVFTSEVLWVEDDGLRCEILTDRRVGIGYASQEDQDRLWRFKMVEPSNLR